MLKFELSEQTVEIIARALGQMPFSVAAPVVTELQQQINAQRQDAAPPVSRPSGKAAKTPAAAPKAQDAA